MPRALLKGGLQVGKAGVAIGAEHHELAVQRDALRRELGDGVGDGGHAVRPIEPLAGEELHLGAGLARLNAVAVQLQLVQPVAGRGRCRGFECKLGREKVRLAFFGELGEGFWAERGWLECDCLAGLQVLRLRSAHFTA